MSLLFVHLSISQHSETHELIVLNLNEHLLLTLKYQNP